MSFWKSTKKIEQDKSEGDASMSDATVIDFGEVLDISFAAKFHSQLKDESESSKSIKFVTSNLTRIDASCLQVLVCFVQYAKENEISVQWENPGEVITEATRLTGLTNVLALSH